MRQFTVTVKLDPKLAPLIEADVSGDMTVYLSETPERGAANKDLTDLIAAHLDVPKGSVHIVRGVASTVKLIRVTD
jgi:uncharacterized protein YggU (UPF0235/DUF167 family)